MIAIHSACPVCGHIKSNQEKILPSVWKVWQYYMLEQILSVVHVSEILANHWTLHLVFLRNFISIEIFSPQTLIVFVLAWM